MAIRTILAPVAGTAIDERVMETAFRMAKRFDAHLEALFVAAEPQDAIPIVGEGMSGLIIEEMIRAAEKKPKNAKSAARHRLRPQLRHRVSKHPILHPGKPSRPAPGARIAAAKMKPLPVAGGCLILW